MKLSVIVALLSVAVFTGAGSVHANAMHTRPRLLVKDSGNGVSVTRTFKAPARWNIAYSFRSCQAADFSIHVMGGSDDVVTAAGLQGSGVEFEYRSGRAIHLEVDSTCRWTLAAHAAGRTVMVKPNSFGLRFKGSGSKNTEQFKVTRTWATHYRFWSCTIDSFSGYVDGGSGGVWTKSGDKGSGIEYEDAVGKHYIAINSGCHWRLRVTTA